MRIAPIAISFKPQNKPSFGEVVYEESGFESPALKRTLSRIYDDHYTKEIAQSQDYTLYVKAYPEGRGSVLCTLAPPDLSESEQQKYIAVIIKPLDSFLDIRDKLGHLYLTYTKYIAPYVNSN